MKRVLVYRLDNGGSAYYRGQCVAELLNEHTIADATYLQGSSRRLAAELEKSYDAVLTGPIGGAEILGIVKALGKRLILDWDEFVGDGADDEYGRNHPDGKARMDFFEAADAVVYGTLRLAEMQPTRVPSTVAPLTLSAAARDRHHRRQQPSHTRNIWLACNDAHLPDVETITEPLQRLLAADPWIVMYLVCPMDGIPKYLSLPPTRERYIGYQTRPAYHLQGPRDPYRIRLAPLADRPHAMGRGETRYVESALFGIPGVYTPHGYPSVKHGETGLLASTPDEWVAAISTLLDDDALCARLTENSWEDIWSAARRKQTAGVYREVIG